MLQRYKLRLGDGTVLGVDHEGLKTWALDGQAMVQAAASHRWYPLKAFLAAERAAARKARSRQGGSGPQPTPTPGPLPLVYPKPRGVEVPPPEEGVPAAAAPFLAEPSAVEVLAEPIAGPVDRPPEQISEPTLEPISEPEVAPLVARTMDAPLAPSTDPLRLPAEALVAPDAEALAPSAPEPSLAPVQGWVDVPAAVNEPANVLLFEEDLEAAAVGDPEQDWISDDDLSPLPPKDALPSPESTAPREEAWLPRWEDEPQARLLPSGLAVAPALPSPPLPRPSLQVLADDLAPVRSGPPAPARNPSDDLPIIPLKALDDETPAREERASPAERPPETEGSRARSELDETLVRWFVRGISAYDALLTRWIVRLTRRPASIASGNSMAARATDGVSAPPEAEPPIFEPPILESPIFEPPILEPPILEPPILERPREAEGSAREPLKEPPAIRDLPLLPFATIEQPDDGGEVYETEGRHSAVWRSTKRVVVTSGLLAGGLFAALTGKTWLPRAEQLGQAAFSQLDRIQQDRDFADRQRQALQEATERLPHLAPQTIRLLMVNDPTGVLDPPEMFRIASDAADRGRGALDSEEARELEELRRELFASLRPSERERVRAYDAARARRLVFPFEGQDVLELVGRGAYALPPERRARLQDLYAKAIAAGLPVSPATPGPLAQP